jgi:hypothetical protein
MLVHFSSILRIIVCGNCDYNSIAFPYVEFVFVLNAADHILKERVLNLPEAVVAGTHNNEEGYNYSKQTCVDSYV